MPAHERAVERGCEAMQVFNQSPRMWRPTRWKPDDVAEFLKLRRSGPIGSTEYREALIAIALGRLTFHWRDAD